MMWFSALSFLCSVLIGCHEPQSQPTYDAKLRIFSDRSRIAHYERPEIVIKCFLLESWKGKQLALNSFNIAYESEVEKEPELPFQNELFLLVEQLSEEEGGGRIFIGAENEYKMTIEETAEPLFVPILVRPILLDAGRVRITACLRIDGKIVARSSNSVELEIGSPTTKPTTVSVP